MRIIQTFVIGNVSILLVVYLGMVFLQGANDINHTKRINNHLVKCVDNVSYFVGYGSTLTLKVDINNKPVPCDF